VKIAIPPKTSGQICPRRANYLPAGKKKRFQYYGPMYTNGTNFKEGTKRAQTGGEGEYQHWQELV
jgi:hypothetical protein